MEIILNIYGIGVIVYAIIGLFVSGYTNNTVETKGVLFSSLIWPMEVIIIAGTVTAYFVNSYKEKNEK